MIDLEKEKPESFDIELDAKGLTCPLPILKTKKELNEMDNGQVIKITTTDPLAPLDFKAFCVHAAHKLVYMFESEELCEFYIEKGSR